MVFDSGGHVNPKKFNTVSGGIVNSEVIKDELRPCDESLESSWANKSLLAMLQYFRITERLSTVKKLKYTPRQDEINLRSLASTSPEKISLCVVDLEIDNFRKAAIQNSSW